MEPENLRGEILRLLGQHEATGSSVLLEDKVIVDQLKVPLADVQRQLLIMRHRGWVELAVVYGPWYSARLTPGGMEVLEAADRTPEPRRIGF
jgi:hypothetical protein